MDVTVGSKDVSLSKRRLVLLFILSIFVFFGGVSVSTAQEKKPFHTSGDRTRWDRNNDRVTIRGNATFRQPGETLKADFIEIDFTERTVKAVGNCVYKSVEIVIYCDELYFHLDTRVGTIVGGKVTNGGFLLSGDRINKLSDARYQAHRAEYTTCHDCPSAFAFQADDIDLEFEGYAFLSGGTAKINDVPILWFPYFVFPVKSKRQSGFLVPKTHVSSVNGIQFVLPFFWAMGRSADMTLGAGIFSKRGERFEWEGRYSLSDNSHGTARFFYLNDSIHKAELANARNLDEDNLPEKRWSFEVSQFQELPWGVYQKLRAADVSDSKYLWVFRDFSGYGDPALQSSLSFSKPTEDLNVSIGAQVYRNLWKFDQPTVFDPQMVQLFPYAKLNTADRFLGDWPIAFGLALEARNFTRVGGAFDYDLGKTSGPFIEGTDPVRKAVRALVLPRAMMTLRPWGAFSIVPSIRYYSYFYDFEPGKKDLVRNYALFQTDFSFQLEKIYKTGDPTRPKIKHTVKPFLTYSNIPVRKEDEEHFFVKQVNYRNGYQFDSDDIIPYDQSPNLVNYSVPLGHSISYGVDSSLIERRDDPDTNDVSYFRKFGFQAGQTLNILEYDKPRNERIPLSRLFANFDWSLDQFHWSAQYYYYPLLSRLLPNIPESKRSPHEVSTSISYVFERGKRQEVMDFDRSISLNYNWRYITSDREATTPDPPQSNMGAEISFSISDNILPKVTGTYDFTSHVFTGATLAVAYQSTSRCWKIVGSMAYVPPDVQYKIGLELNFMGSGFGVPNL